MPDNTPPLVLCFITSGSLVLVHLYGDFHNSAQRSHHIGLWINQLLFAFTNR
jgi:hypothetical protein